MIDLSNGLVGRFWVQGRPRTKGSMKCVGQKGKHALIEDHKLSKPWRVTMTNEIRRTIADAGYHGLPGDGGWIPYAGPTEVRITFFFERIVGVSGDVWPSHQTPYPESMDVGDLDKLDRNVLDALVSGGLIADDRFVCRIVSDKRWAAKGNPGGVQIQVLKYPADVTATDWPNVVVRSIARRRYRDAQESEVGCDGKCWFSCD